MLESCLRPRGPTLVRSPAVLQVDGVSPYASWSRWNFLSSDEDILSGPILQDGCNCTSSAKEGWIPRESCVSREYLEYLKSQMTRIFNALPSDCSLEKNTKYSGHNLYSRKGINVGNMAGCARLCFRDSKCKFWTHNPRLDKEFWLTLHRLSYTECPSAGLRLQTKEGLHLQRGQPLDRKRVEL